MLVVALLVLVTLRSLVALLATVRRGYLVEVERLLRVLWVLAWEAV